MIFVLAMPYAANSLEEVLEAAREMSSEATVFAVLPTIGDEVNTPEEAKARATLLDLVKRLQKGGA